MSSTDFPQTPATPNELPGSEDDRDDEEYVPLDEPDVSQPTPSPETQTEPTGSAPMPERYH